MPLDQKELLRQKEQDAEKYLAGRPGAIDAGISDTASVIDASRKNFASDVTNAGAEAAAKYGLPGDTAQASGPAVDYQSQNLDRANESGLALRQVRERQANVNQTFNYVFGRMVQAGMDVNQAKQTAMQYALDQDRRTAEAAGNQKARELALQKQDMMDQYSAQRIAMQRKYAEDAQKQAIYNGMLRSFFGLAGGAVGGYAGGLIGSTVASKAVG